MTNYLTEEDVVKLLEKQQKTIDARIEKATSRLGTVATTVDINPETRYIYESNGLGIIPPYDQPVLDHDKWMEIYQPTEEQKKALVGKTFDNDREEDCYTDEYLGRYQEFKAKMNEAKKTNNMALAGSVITSNHFSVIKATIDASRVLGFQLSSNVLENAVTVQNAPRLQAKYRNWEGFEIMTHVPEGMIVEAKKGHMTESTFAIQKDVGAAAITIEAEITLEGDIFGDHITWIAKKMRKEKNKKIATALNTTVTSVAGADWGPYTGDRSTNDPGETFLTIVNQLNPNGYRVDTIVTNPKPKREYFQNTFIKGIFSPVGNVTNSPATFSTPGIEGNPTWYSDADITTDTIAFAFAREVIVLFEGPKRQTEIGRPDAEVREYFSRDFNDCFIVDQNGIRKITGITA